MSTPNTSALQLPSILPTARFIFSLKEKKFFTHWRLQFRWQNRLPEAPGSRAGLGAVLARPREEGKLSGVRTQPEDLWGSVSPVRGDLAAVTSREAVPPFASEAVCLSGGSLHLDLW